jgi:hypothetical protein
MTVPQSSRRHHRRRGDRELARSHSCGRALEQNSGVRPHGNGGLHRRGTSDRGSDYKCRPVVLTTTMSATAGVAAAGLSPLIGAVKRSLFRPVLTGNPAGPAGVLIGVCPGSREARCTARDIGRRHALSRRREIGFMEQVVAWVGGPVGGMHDHRPVSHAGKRSDVRGRGERRDRLRLTGRDRAFA